MTGRHRRVHVRRARILLTTGRTAGQTASWAALVAALPLALARPDPGLWLSAITAAWAAPVATAELPRGWPAETDSRVVIRIPD